MRMPDSSRCDCQLCELSNSVDDMTSCEGCGKLFHLSCAGLDDGKKVENWKCRTCVAESASNGTGGNSGVPVSDGQQNVNGSTSGADSIGELTRLNLKLLEERKAYMLKEIELQQTTQLEHRKLQLVKEVWKARYDIVNAMCEATRGDTNSGGLGDWMSRLDQFAVSQNQLISAPASTVTVPTLSSGTRPQNPAAGGAQTIPQTTSSLPAAVAFFGGESIHPVWPISPGIPRQV